MNNLIIDTQFAPAERAATALLWEQAQQIESLDLLDPMLSAVPDAVIILNKQRQIIYANTPFLQLLGTNDMNKIIGLRPGEAVNCIHAFETEGGCGTTEFCSQCGAVNAILKSQKSGERNIQECRINTKSGDDIQALDLRVWATPFEYENETFTVFAVSNIADEKRRRILERVFFHDVTNTAGAIQGLIEILNDTEDMAELREFGLHSMLTQASTMLLDEIQAQRQLMAAENGELTVEPAHFDSKPFLEQLIGVYQNHLVAEGKYVQLDANVDNCMMLSDRALLGRVVSNMIKNALEASAPGETVTVGCQQLYDYVRFWVHNPKPMPQHVQLQIFQRSFSTKGSDRGLGTYSMKLLSENYLQGRVSFISEQDTGTTFMGMYPLEWREIDKVK